MEEKSGAAVQDSEIKMKNDQGGGLLSFLNIWTIFIVFMVNINSNLGPSYLFIIDHERAPVLKPKPKIYYMPYSIIAEP